MSSRWWRAYDEAVDDPKLQRLPPPLFKSWFNLMCIASMNGGVLPSIEDVAFKLHVSKLKAELTVSALHSAGLVDEIETGKFAPHNWSGRQFQSDVSTERVKRFRNTKRNVSTTVSETPPETEADTETDSEAYASAPSAPEELNLEVVDEDEKAKLFRIGKPILISFGIAEKRTGSLIGQWLKAQNDPAGLLAALQFARDQNVAEPVAYVSAIMHGKSKNGALNGNDRRQGESLSDFCRRLAADARELEGAARGSGQADAFRRH
jgi:hypothetical protein